MYWANDIGNMGALARRLNVDGVIIVYHHLMYGGVVYGQQSISGHLTPKVDTVIAAYDRQGKKVLTHVYKYESDTEIPIKNSNINLQRLKQELLRDARTAGTSLSNEVNSLIKG